MKEDNMMFSVLISVYWKEKPNFLKDCLNSIVNQTILPKEIVIIKDGKLTDELDEIIAMFDNDYPNLFKIIEFKENMGLGRALSIGVENCKYKLIARMDTDDIAREDRFEKQLLEFKSNPKLDIVGSHIEEFEGDLSNVLAKKSVPLTHFEILNFSKMRNPFNHMTVMYKKESVIRVGNYQHVHGLGYEDYDLWIRMLIDGCTAKNIDDYLVYARTGMDMIKRRGNKERLRTALYFRKKMYKLGFITFFEFLQGSAANILVSSLPNRGRLLIYKLYLRK